ncbi:MAG: glycosyl transferase [Rhodobacterales bacterium]|nr:MAG: glycosyl transferase [Rhodobacterales bacterium]
MSICSCRGLPWQYAKFGAINVLTVIIPAHNEAAQIDDCLQSVLGSQADFAVQIIVVANGCQDDTAAVAATYQAAAQQRGWELQVIDLAQGGKLGALNAGDRAARYGQRVYLDADVILSPALLGQIAQALASESPRYASGTLTIPRPASCVSRAYRAVYQKVPFMTHGVPGAGLFAMNAAGRGRWGEWPDIISDDTYARLMFAPAERILLSAPYDWPIVEGWANLVAVRRRQNAGVDEIRRLYPELLQNDDTPKLGLAGKLGLALAHPIGFAVYAGVALAVRLSRPKGRGDWRRGR